MKLEPLHGNSGEVEWPPGEVGTVALQESIRGAAARVSLRRSHLRRMFWGLLAADALCVPILIADSGFLHVPGWGILGKSTQALLFTLFFAGLFGLLIFPILFPVPALQRGWLRGRLGRQLSGLSREQVEAVLLPLRNDTQPDTRKLVEPLIARLCPGAPTEVTPAASPTGAGQELSP